MKKAKERIQVNINGPIWRTERKKWWEKNKQNPMKKSSGEEKHRRQNNGYKSHIYNEKYQLIDPISWVNYKEDTCKKKNTT